MSPFLGCHLSPWPPSWQRAPATAPSPVEPLPTVEKSTSLPEGQRDASLHSRAPRYPQPPPAPPKPGGSPHPRTQPHGTGAGRGGMRGGSAPRRPAPLSVRRAPGRMWRCPRAAAGGEAAGAASPPPRPITPGAGRERRRPEHGR